jgi:hypothetical protein
MQLNLKKIENILSESFNELKLNNDNSLDLLFHIGTIDSKYEFSIIKAEEIKPKNIKDLDPNLKIYFTNLGKPVVHLDSILKENSVFDYKKSKYFYFLSSSIIIHCSSETMNRFFEVEIIKFLFVTGIENFLNGNATLKKVTLLFENEANEEMSRDMIKKIWSESLLYTGFNANQENLKVEDLFAIDIQNSKTWSDKFFQENKASGTITIEDFSQISSSVISLSEIVSYLPENVLLDDDYQQIHDSFVIGKIFNDLWLTSNNVINHWNSYVSNGKVIENFGSSVSSFLSGMMEEFEKALPSKLKNNMVSIEKIKELSDMVQGRITSLFTSQLLILQTQALDKFKDLLVWQAKNSQKEFEFEKGIAITQVNDWFESKASKISIPEMRLDFIGAKKELQQVLGEVSEKFKESAVSKLISIQKTGKKTSKGKLKQSGVVIGFGITAAVRPRGFGNLQLVSSYSHGPHVFNFSLVNDLDVAEQEGQTRIKPIRIQPSLNFDVDI